jgi:hypothetical protein
MREGVKNELRYWYGTYGFLKRVRYPDDSVDLHYSELYHDAHGNYQLYRDIVHVYWE